jgi:hypothetical protein
MKALSMTQPWATAIFRLNKQIETRSWKTDYRGQIAIHAAKGFPKYAKEFAQTERALGRIPARLSLGAIIGFVTIVDMKRTEDIVQEISALERLYGDYSVGRWAWMLTEFISIEPIFYKGHLGLWKVSDGILGCAPAAMAETK